MLKKLEITTICLVICLLLFGCVGSGEDLSTGPTNSGEWNIPENEIISGGVPKDGIPSLFNPEMISAEDGSYLIDDALVVGMVVAGQPMAYPHSIMDWHEIVNEDSNVPFTLSYCPLTGTAVAFDGTVLGKFGVSGLLYRNNLIMFDRRTDSRWPQLRLQSDQGPSKDTKIRVLPTIETSWGTWKKLFPGTLILSTNTGFNRPYGQPGSAYPGYSRLNSSPLFQQKGIDNRLPPKQRVHGILLGTGPEAYQSKVYLIQETQERRLINDVVANKAILVVDVGEKNFVLSFLRTVDGQTLTFELAGSADIFPFTFKDKETGSTWTVLGEATDGPLTGKELERPLSINAFWFAWGAFYEGADIYDN
ncbi:MAG: DUF3179 domain-containing protein [Caldithrix sp.]|nr:MAG: DUF3179 domain-containing protein [Caldithrix sp.]